MKKEFKKMFMLNFNCTFGHENEELLDHFQDYFYPALISGYKRELPNGSSYKLSSVSIQEDETGKRKVLTGLITHDTILENTGVPEGPKMKRVNETMEAYPTSIFLIFLDNHKMAFIPLQKGSPRYTEFSATIRDYLKTFRKEYNKNKDKSLRLPYAVINIEPIPSKKKITDYMETIQKMKQLQLKLYPLNASEETSSAVRGIRELLNETGSKTNHIISKSPTDKDKVAEIIDSASQYSNITLKAIDYDGNRITMTNDDFKAETDIEIDTAKPYLDENISEVLKIASGFEIFSDVQPQQKKSYNRFINKFNKK